jgi:hypothetical protein
MNLHYRVNLVVTKSQKRKGKIMGLFNGLFGSKISPDKIGEEVREMAKYFLKNTDDQKYSPESFTELYAFIFFEFDSQFFLLGLENRGVVTSALANAFRSSFEKDFSDADVDTFEKILDERIEEYGKLLRDRRNKSAFVDRLDYYLRQANCLGSAHKKDSPVVIVDVFAMVAGRSDVGAFYIKTLAPYLLKLIQKFQ